MLETLLLHAGACVLTSTAIPGDDHRVDPLRYVGARKEARSALLAIIKETQRTELVVAREDYIWVEYRTWGMRFVDDVEFYLPEGASVVHFRSASRAGQGDLGVNRRRYELIVATFRDRIR